MNISIYLYIIAIAVIVGAMRYNKLSPHYIKWMVPFLLLSLAVEITGLIMSRNNIQNLWMYNFFTCFEFVFYSLLFKQVLNGTGVKNVISYAVIVYVLLFLLNIFLVQGFTKYHTITYRIGSVMVVTWCYLYFRQLMRSGEYVQILKEPFFWISTGLIFFYAGFFFYMSAADLIMYQKLQVNTLVFKVISDSLNIILYTCFLISFLCRQTNNTTIFS